MATHTHTTPTRRALIGAGAATLLLAAPATGEAKTRDLDGELLAMCERHAELTAEEDRLYKARDEDAGEAVGALVYDSEREISVTPARTPEGIQAKARAALLYLDHEHPDGDDVIEGLTRSILHDLVGRMPA